MLKTAVASDLQIARWFDTLKLNNIIQENIIAQSNLKYSEEQASVSLSYNIVLALQVIVTLQHNSSLEIMHCVRSNHCCDLCITWRWIAL